MDRKIFRMLIEIILLCNEGFTLSKYLTLAKYIDPGGILKKYNCYNILYNRCTV